MIIPYGRHVRRGWVYFLAIAASTGSAAVAAEELAASKSVMVQKTGPRTGDSAGKYFNVQGKRSGDGGKYACFGVLEFAAPKSDAKIKGMTLTLVQSVPPFAKDGKIRFYLTTDTKTPLAGADGAAGSPLKFNDAAADALGDQLRPRHAIGSAAFKKQETGHPDSFALTLDSAAIGYLKSQIEKGGSIRLIVVPDDDDVAATYAGSTNPTAASRPKLTIEFDSAK
jgi:hypothetical protein